MTDTDEAQARAAFAKALREHGGRRTSLGSSLRSRH
jgi:hypothetical protein